jgi:hypothetical protein
MPTDFDTVANKLGYEVLLRWTHLWDSAGDAIMSGDMDSHIHYGKEFHKLSDHILSKTNIDLREMVS